MRKPATFLVTIIAVTVGLTILLVSGMFLSALLMMDGNLGMMVMMMWPTMFLAMLWPAALVGFVAAVVGVVAYNLLLPKINPTRISEAAPVDYRDAVLRLLKEDERRVVDALRSSGGTAFQRDLQHATGFSKVKIHRVIARLAERHLVEVTAAGKTNQIRLPAWLLGDTRNSSDRKTQP